MDDEVKKPEEEVTPPVAPDNTTPPPDAAPPADEAGAPPVEDAAAEPEMPGWQRKVKEYYSDREFESDEDLSAAAEEMISDLMDYKTKGQEANAKLVEIFESEPAIAEFISDVMQGASPEVAIARNFDVDSLTPMEDEEDRGPWEEAKKMRKQRFEEQKKFEEELTTNQVESSKAFDAFVEENGLSEEEADGLLDEIDTLLKDIYRGFVSKDFLTMMHKATGYEDKLAQARKEAALQAKNDNVKLAKKNYDKPKGDGLPKVNGSGAPQDKPQRPKTRFEQSLQAMEEKEKRRI